MTEAEIEAKRAEGRALSAALLEASLESRQAKERVTVAADAYAAAVVEFDRARSKVRAAEQALAAWGRG